MAPLNELTSGRGVTTRRDEHINDLPELINSTVDVAPLPADLDVGLVDLPAITHQMAAWPGGVGQKWREPLDPAVDRDVVDLDTAVGEELLDVAVGQAEAEVPADRDDDDVGREAEAGKGGPRNWSTARAAGSHAATLATPRRSQRMQQRPFR
jgi:hypothetical protein